MCFLGEDQFDTSRECGVDPFSARQPCLNANLRRRMEMTKIFFGLGAFMKITLCTGKVVSTQIFSFLY